MNRKKQQQLLLLYQSNKIPTISVKKKKQFSCFGLKLQFNNSNNIKSREITEKLQLQQQYLQNQCCQI